MISSYHWSVVNYCSVDSMADPGGASVAAAPSGGTAPDFFLGGGNIYFRGAKVKNARAAKCASFELKKCLKMSF